MRLLKKPPTQVSVSVQLSAPCSTARVVGQPHAVGVEIGVVAEGDAKRHQREGDRKAEEDRQDQDQKHQDGDERIAHFCRPVRRCRADHSPTGMSTASRAVLEHVEGLRLHQDLLGLLDIVDGAEPFAGPQADDAAEHLGDALEEEQDAGGDDDRLELEDRNVGRALGADFEIAPGAAGVFPAGEDQRQHAGEEEQEIEHELDAGLRARLPQPVEEVAAHMAVARQRVGAGHHEQRAVEHVAEVEGPGRRRAEGVAHDDLVADADGHRHDAPGEDLAEPGRQIVGEFYVANHRRVPHVVLETSTERSGSPAPFRRRAAVRSCSG